MPLLPWHPARLHSACNQLRSSPSSSVMNAGHNKQPFATLSVPVIDRILGEVFEADRRSVAARAQLSLVCKCAVLRATRIGHERLEQASPMMVNG